MSFDYFPPSYYFNPPDIGFFLFDIGSDVYNGKSLIQDGNPIWGTIVVGAIFIPMTIIYVTYAIHQYCIEDCPKRRKLLILIFTPILALPLIPVMTVCYICYVLYVSARKCVQPRYDPDDDHWAENFKLIEANAEANLQAVLGSLTSLFNISI